MLKDNTKCKIWVFNTICVALIMFILLVTLSLLLKPVSVNRKNIAGYYAEKNNSIDAVFIGGSSTYVLWSPYYAWNKYGFTSYDFATDAMAPALLKGMIEEASKTQSPELYVIDLRAIGWREFHPTYYSDAYIRNITDSMNYSVNRLKTIYYTYSIEHPELAYRPSTYLDIMMYHSQWNQVNGESVKYLFNNYPSEYKGWCFANTLYHTPLVEYDWSDYTVRKDLSYENQIVLEDLLQYCKDNEMNVLFTVNPICMENPDEQAYFNTVADEVSKYGFDFVNSNLYYDEMGIDFSRDFYDGAHCNLLGAEKYTEFLGKYICDNYDMPDRRKESGYDEWNEGYYKYNEMAIKQKRIIEAAIKQNSKGGDR